MPLILRGKLKDRLEIQWDNNKYDEILLCPQDKSSEILHCIKSKNQNKIHLNLSDLDFSKIKTKELSIIAVAGDLISEPLKILMCPHDDCNRWGHIKADGYCKHCGRRVKRDSHTMGFPKLGISGIEVTLFDKTKGTLWKSKEEYEYGNRVYSVGEFQEENNVKKKVDILEEKFSDEAMKKFTQLQKILENSDLSTCWRPPLVCFQKKYNRILWIYTKVKEESTPSITAYDYITNKVNEPLTTQDILAIGIQLCNIARTIHSYKQYWCSLKLADLVLQRTKEGKYPVSIYVRSKDISWQDNQSQKLLDISLIPWELYWDNPSSKQLSSASEVYIIAAVLYLLKAKSPNLLHYNPISCQYGLPSLKLFKSNNQEYVPEKNAHNKYFESIINQALISHPEERGYQCLSDFEAALESLYVLENKSIPFSLEVGSDLDVGDDKHHDDFTENQDSLFTTYHSLTKKGWGLFVLCDGISTSNIGSGADASRIVVETFKKWWQDNDEETHKKVCEYAIKDLKKGSEFLNSLINTANNKIRQKVDKYETNEFSSIMGSTVIAGLVYNDILLFGWIGDSPVFRFSPFGWERLNFEDNERNNKLLSGVSLDEALADGGNAITRCIGANFYTKKHIDMHFDYTYLSPNESILICSDGIPDYIEPEADFSLQENYRMMRLASIISSYDSDALINAKALASILVSGTNRISGGKDNLSAIIFRTHPKSFKPSIESYSRLRLLSFIRQKKLQRANNETAKVTRRVSITGDNF